MVRERLLWRIKEGGGGMCHRVAIAIDNRFGWPMVGDGTYLSRDGRVICGSGHCWNVLPDGSVLDATADQWCEGHNVRIVRPGEADYLRYRVGFQDGFNPGTPNPRWPELAACPWEGVSDARLDGRAGLERGHGWWSDDPEAVRAKWESYVFLYVAHERSRTTPCCDGDPASPIGRLNALATETRALVKALPDSWDYGDVTELDAGMLAAEGADAVRALAGAWEASLTDGGHGSDTPGIELAAHCMKAYRKWILQNPVTAGLPLQSGENNGPAVCRR